MLRKKTVISKPMTVTSLDEMIKNSCTTNDRIYW